jgi:site-specific DNA-methyltransferase (adenine-specific)
MNDDGSAARFFYCAKPSSKEKNGGLDNFEKKCPDIRSDVGKGSWVEKGPAIQSNDHPTVKPIKLLQYLAKLITPPGGVILDPFAGSGSTGLAAREEGFDVIMIEQDKHYCDIIKGRLVV